jgi:hypothetical protein
MEDTQIETTELTSATDTNTKNAGEPWSAEEDEQLNKLYNTDKLDILEISKIHGRNPGGIISRLLKNNYIPNRMSARGYKTYKNSDLYKSIVESGKERKKITKEEQKSIQNNTYIGQNIGQNIDDHNINVINIDKNNYTDLINNINTIKNEILDLKIIVKDLVNLLK